MQSVLAFLLLPLAWLYAGVLAIRNWLYEVGWKRAETFAVPLLNVGNLRVGGTGKTPHVIWLVEELLRQGHRPAILSRGYGRRTQGPRLAGPPDSAATVGDEPWQYFEQFAPQHVPVAVAEKRRLGVPLLLANHPEITVIVLDDAYQHRAVQPTLNVLLTEWARPFYQDQVLPAGRLRESRHGARRAGVVIVSKCPVGLSEVAQAAIKQRVSYYTRPGAPVLFSAYDYGTPQLLSEAGGAAAGVAAVVPVPGPAVLLTGIAQPGPLREYLENEGYHIQYHAVFPDHYAFQPRDLEALRTHWQPGWPIFTTEKDATRLLAPNCGPAHGAPALYHSRAGGVSGQWRHGSAPAIARCAHAGPVILLLTQPGATKTVRRICYLLEGTATRIFDEVGAAPVSGGRAAALGAAGGARRPRPGGRRLH